MCYVLETPAGMQGITKLPKANNKTCIIKQKLEKHGIIMSEQMS